MYYTNISFTDKQIEEAPKTYDKLESNGLFDIIFNAIPDSELEFLEDCINETAADITSYANSALSLVKTMSNDAGALDEQLNDILEKIKNKEDLEELSAIKDIVK